LLDRCHVATSKLDVNGKDVDDCRL
jgi:hypothetical protein